ncbi:hypothetical protein ABDK56_01440 [Sphingomonas sp. ASV193]|uniref:hypothetical protein n=1 Tax=Sphingomonas sp. ASV193 TaxID=3144405 RepID=UPI0032E87AAE
MNPGDFMALCVTILLPTIVILYGMRRWFSLREKRLDIEAMQVAEKAAQYVSHSKDVEARLAVLERIVTDGGYETAAKIDALRQPKRLDA